jgi:hypothetical protein
MARTNLSFIYGDLLDDVIKPAVFIDLGFTNPLYINSTQKNYTVDSNVYHGAGALLGFSGVEETSDMGATGITLTLGLSSAGSISNVLTAAINADYQGADIKIYLALLDDDNEIVGNGSTPYLAPLFFGFMDTMSISDAGDGAVIQLTAESNLIRLGRVHSRRYTDEDQQEYWNTNSFTDKGLNLVNRIQEQVSIWGRNA